MDFDDAGPSGAASKPLKFAPKSRFQPKPRSKPKPEPKKDDSPSVAVKKEPHPDQTSEAVEMDTSEPTISSLNLNGANLQFADGVDLMDVDTNTVSNGNEPPELEEEDTVVSEIDVYFKPSPIAEGAKLFVLQYPLRASWRPYELDEKCKIRVKPASADVEIDLPVDMGSENFDPDAPGAERFNKLTLSSKWKPLPRTAYAIGVYTGSEVHLNPVYSITQLRPSMENLNPSAPKKKNVSEDATKASSSKAEPAPNKAKDQKENETCVPLEFHGSSSHLSARYTEKMLVVNKSPLQFPMKPLEYLDSVCPQPAIDKPKPVAQTKRSLLSLPLEQRLKSLFTEGDSIQKFSALKHYALDHTIEDVLGAVEQCALLVQGNWVAKTAIRYPKADGTKSFLRDYALCRFSQGTTIKYSSFEWMKNIRKVWKDAFGDVAVERHKCEDWKFIKPTDTKFIKDHPEIVEKYKQKWKAMEEQLQVTIDQRKKPTRPNASSKINPALVSNQGTVNSHSAASTRTWTMTNEAREAFPIAVRKVFQAHKVCSYQTICSSLRSMALNVSAHPKGDANGSVLTAAAFGLTAPPEEILEVISEVVVNIHGAFVMKVSLENPELNPLRNVVIGLFIGKGPNAKVKKSEIVEAAKMQLQKEPSNEEFRKVVSEFCESSGSAWVLKSGDGKPEFSGSGNTSAK